MEDRNSEEKPIRHHWRNWISTGDLIQLAAMLIIVAAAFTRVSAYSEETRAMVIQQNTLLAQLHESVDQLRMSRSMTPEAAQRVTALETRMSTNELNDRDLREEINSRLTRIEDLLVGRRSR